jgi:tetratricopeptide (TPR) repeat protein
MTFGLGQGKDSARLQTACPRGSRPRAIWVWPALAMLLVAFGYDSLKQERPSPVGSASAIPRELPRSSAFEARMMATDESPKASIGATARQPIRLTSSLSFDTIRGPSGQYATDSQSYSERGADDLLWEFPQLSGEPLLARLPLVSTPSDQLPNMIDINRRAIVPNRRQRQMVTLLPPQAIGPADSPAITAEIGIDVQDRTEYPSGATAPLGPYPEATRNGPELPGVPPEGGPEQTVPEQIVPEQLRPENPLPEQPVSEWIMPGKTEQTEDTSEAKSIEPVQLSDEAAALATGARTGAKVNELAMAKINHGRQLAERGAYFAARQEFLQVLRMIARARDAKMDNPIHLRALAEGLRAMDEAEDFVPRGTVLEANIDLKMITSSHRTSLRRMSPESDESKDQSPETEESMIESPESGQLMPQQYISRYFHYAQLRLSEAVAGEPSGSMALHALGKVTHHQAELEPERYPLAHRRAFTYQQAALLAHGQNHLAAHELGVLLADSGHYIEAQRLLLEVASRQPHPTVYRNLAKVQIKLGNLQLAEANMRLAEQQANPEDQKDRLVRWISPAEFVKTGNSATLGLPQPAAAVSTQTSPIPDSRNAKTPSPWRWPWSRGQSSELAPLHAAKTTETRSMPARSAANTPRTYR